jgi:hypothetical protein
VALPLTRLGWLCRYYCFHLENILETIISYGLGSRLELVRMSAVSRMWAAAVESLKMEILGPKDERDNMGYHPLGGRRGAGHGGGRRKGGAHVRAGQGHGPRGATGAKPSRPPAAATQPQPQTQTQTQPQPQPHAGQ